MLVEFLHDLFDHGRVRVSHPDQPDRAASFEDDRQLLLSYEGTRRPSFPGEPPSFSLDVAA